LDTSDKIINELNRNKSCSQVGLDEGVKNGTNQVRKVNTSLPGHN